MTRLFVTVGHTNISPGHSLSPSDFVQGRGWGGLQITRELFLPPWWFTGTDDDNTTGGRNKILVYTRPVVFYQTMPKQYPRNSLLSPGLWIEWGTRISRNVFRTPKGAIFSPKREYRRQPFWHYYNIVF